MTKRFKYVFVDNGTIRETETHAQIEDFENGLEIKYLLSYGAKKIFRVNEYYDGKMLTTMSVHNSNNIHDIKYIVNFQYNIRESRYTNNNLSTYYGMVDDTLHGQYIKYDIDGTILDIKYFDMGNDVTEDVCRILSIDHSNLNYEIQEEDKFKLYLKYGMYFLVLDDYKKQKRFYYKDVLKNIVKI